MTLTALLIANILYLAVSLAAVAACTAGAVRKTAAARRHRALENLYLKRINRLLFGNGQDEVTFPYLDRPGAKLLLAELLASLEQFISDYDEQRIRMLVAREQLDRFLLRRAHRTGGTGRARCQRLLAKLPVSGHVVAKACRLQPFGNPYATLYTLILRIVADPDRTVETVGNCRADLSLFEITEISDYLQHNYYPTDYQAMLGSGRNDRLLGMSIVRDYQIREADELLYRNLAFPDPEVRDVAFRVLASLKSPLDTEPVVRAVAALPEAERKRLYRYFVSEGYSMQALSAFEQFERDGVLKSYISSLLDSRKRRLDRTVKVS